MSQAESAIRVVLAFNAAMNRHAVTEMMQLFGDDCVFEHFHPAPDGSIYTGRQAITHFWQGFFQERPDAHIEIEEVFGMGMRCLLRWRLEHGQHTGSIEHMRGIDIFQINHDQISRQWSYIKG